MSGVDVNVGTNEARDTLYDSILININYTTSTLNCEVLQIDDFIYFVLFFYNRHQKR